MSTQSKTSDNTTTTNTSGGQQVQQDADKVMEKFYAPGVDKPSHQMSIPPSPSLQPGVPSGNCQC